MIRVFFDANTLKAHYTAARDRAQVWCYGCDNCADCGCEVGDDAGLCCFVAGGTPKYLCATFSDISLCDDSPLKPFGVCCTQTVGDADIWEGTCTIDEVECDVVIDWSGAQAQSRVAIYDSATNDDYYYIGVSGANCSGPASRIWKTEAEYIAAVAALYSGNDFWGGWCGTNTVSDSPAYLTHDGLAYGGSVSICNPITGLTVGSC